MFADGEIEKLRLTLVQCREGLMRSPQVQNWTLGENQIEPAAGIGYTALAAVLDRPDPTRGKARTEMSPASPTSNFIPDSPPELPPLPHAPMLERYATLVSDRHTTTPMSSRIDRPSPGLPESAFMDRVRLTGSSFQRDNSKSSMPSHGYSSRSSGMGLTGDNMSEITAPTSVADVEDLMYAQDLDDKPSNQAIRITVDPSKVPRWSPKRRTGSISAAQKTALLVAVQQKNHKMIEQLLDFGVPIESSERNLLTVAIVNHDFASVRLLLLFGADTNSKDKDGFTPLLSATQASFFDAAQLLLKYGANPNLSAAPHGETPFARSLTTGQNPFAHLYLKHGADSDAIMGNGNTAFIHAINRTVPLSLMDLMRKCKHSILLHYHMDHNVLTACSALLRRCKLQEWSR